MNWRLVAMISEIVLVFQCMIISFAAGQKIEYSFAGPGIESKEENVIANAGFLEGFFESLYQQKTFNDRKIRVVHIGDSHIQADYLTSVVRRNFQKHFGNAGRGLIVPFAVAGTNEPPNFISKSNVKWAAKRIVHPDNPMPIGVGGISVETSDPNATLQFYMNDLWQDYTTSSMLLFYENDRTSFDFHLKDTVGSELAYFNSSPAEQRGDTVRLFFSKPAGAFTFQFSAGRNDQKRALVYGLSLENKSNGVLYHAIGVNGARYEHFNKARYFRSQLHALNPDLVIVSLGTNEAAGFPVLDPAFIEHVDKLIQSLRDENPHAGILLVTPPVCYRKKIRQNPGIRVLRDQLVKYARTNNLGYYDMFTVMGGENAADRWRDAGLLRPDGIHFTKAGYEYQGNLLFDAIIKSYNLYVPLRHP